MPWRFARSMPPAPAWLEMATTICAGREPAAASSARFSSVLPPPENRTPSRRVTDISETRGLLDVPQRTDDARDEAVGLRLLGRHPAVTVRVLLDLREGTAGLL